MPLVVLLPLLCAGQVLAAESLAGGQETISLTMALVKTLGALAIVLGLMFFVLNWVRRLGFARDGIGQAGLIRVLDLQMLGAKKHVAVLEVAGEYLAVGITDQQITLLARLPDKEPLQKASCARREGAVLPESFAALLKKAGGRFSGALQTKEGSGDGQ